MRTLLTLLIYVITLSTLQAQDMNENPPYYKRIKTSLALLLIIGKNQMRTLIPILYLTYLKKQRYLLLHSTVLINNAPWA